MPWFEGNFVRRQRIFRLGPHHHRRRLTLRPMEERIILGSGRSLSSKVWGSLEPVTKDGPAGSRWLMLHGYLDNAATFDRIAPLMISSGTAACCVCVDMAGHGKSDFAESYHVIDYVPDVALVADALGWDQFSIMAHSLGGGVAQCFSATFPERVIRLVSIEAIGWWSNEPKDFLHTLRTAVVAAQRRFMPNRERTPPYKTIEDCAERRSKMNLVGSLPIEAAHVLVSRGTRPDERGGFTWSSDPNLLLPSRSRFEEGVIQAIIKGIRCPMLLVFARDGLFQRFALPRLTPFTFPNLMVTATLHGALFIASAACRLVGIKALDNVHQKVKIAFNFNLRWFRAQTAKTMILGSGGHHPHLTRPQDVMNAVEEWAGKSSAGTRDVKKIE